MIMLRSSVLSSLARSTVLCLAALLGTAAVAQNAAPQVRIGVVMPKAQLGQGNTDVAAPTRQLIMSYMAGPVLELVPLEARIPAQIEAEARALNCTHVLYTSVEQKKGGKGLGGMLGKMGPAAAMLPGVGALGSASGAMAAGIASQAIMQAATQSMQQQAMDSLMQTQAGSVKAKDEISLQYQLVTIGGAKPVLEDTLTAKAKQDGQDLLSPLVEQLATVAVTAALQP
jgi:hypothetical protein